MDQSMYPNLFLKSHSHKYGILQPNAHHFLRMTPEQFFWLTLKDNIATNMSGMVLPFKVFDEVLSVKKLSVSGARFEHLIAISPSVKEISFSRDIKVLVGERNDSDGKLLTSLQHREASLYYVLAFAKNKRLKPYFYIPYLIQLLKKLLALAFCNLGIKFYK